MRKKEIVELGVIGVCLIALLPGIMNIINRAKKAKPKITANKTVVLKNVSSIGAHGGDRIIFRKLQEETINLKVRRDPFVAGPAEQVEEVSVSGLTLSAIIWDKDNPIAIINEKISKIGDKIGTNKIVEIKQDRVILNDGTKDFELKLP